MNKPHPLIVGVTGLRDDVVRPQDIVETPTRTGVEIRLDLDGAWRDVLQDQGALIERVAWFSEDAGAVAPEPIIIATVRRTKDGGEFDGTEEERLKVMKIAAMVCDYVDVELGVESEVPLHKVIRSYHDFEGVPDDLDAISHRMREEGGALHKIVCTATCLADNLKIRELLQGRFNLGAFLMGEYGVPSRILGLAWGSKLTYASLKGGPIAPGMVDFQRLANLYRSGDLNDETEIFGITGEHVSHSLSPAIHNVALRASGRNAVYIPLAARDVDDFLDFSRGGSVTGASVTIPFKEQILPHCKKLDQAAETTGAVNTLLWLPEGGWRGRNVDWIGVTDDIAVEYGRPLFGRTALILGAGGAARAAVYGLRQNGVGVRVWNRDVEQAEKLCQDLGGEVVNLDELKGGVDIVVNCTPCGMLGEHEGETAVAWDKLKSLLADDALVYDVIYEPDTTPLLESAEKDGFKTVNGLGMLRRQATEQGKIFGYPLPHDLPAPRRFSRHIWLVGYRGAGKSALARELSIALRRRSLDTDGQIELRGGRKIREIFEHDGEEAFRKLETAAIRKAAASKPDAVIAAGGGAVTREENIKLMRESGMVVFLNAPKDLLIKRLKGDVDRPSLSGGAVDEEVGEMLEKRRPLYESTCNLNVFIEDKPARELAGEIAVKLAEFQP